MKLTVNTKQLVKELKLLSKVAESKSTIPVLVCVELRAFGGARAAEGDTKGRLTLRATNLDVTLTATLKAEVYGEGSCVLPVARLLKAVEKVDSDTVEITFPASASERDSARAIIRAGEFKLFAPHSEGFPETKDVATTGHDIGAAELAVMLARTIPAVTTEESRYTLSGLLMTFHGERLALVATDGHRLALADTACFTWDGPLEIAPGTIMPLRGVRILQLLAADRDVAGVRVRFGFNATRNPHAKKGESGARFCVNSLVTFEFPGRTLTMRVLEGQFPNYEMAIPKRLPCRAYVDGAGLLRAVKRMEAVLKDTYTSAVRVTLCGDVLLEAEDSDGNGVEDTVRAEIEIDAEYDKEAWGEYPTVGFSRKYLADFLNLVKGDVTFEMTNSEAQAVFRPANSDDFLYVIMPLRL